MHQFAKHFTLAEARALLPKLRRLFQDIQRQRQLALRADEQLSQAVTRSGGDAGGRVTVSLVNHLHQMNRRIHRIQGLGIQIKDFDRGLIDFPHLRNGQEVFLCWELEEDDVEFWHGLDDGYAGRERL
ncbi:DUF2203 domain-containing protein [bacterium]|nr:DUF2203 domain-containing protein [bacterium]